MDIVLSPVLRISGDLDNLGHNLFGSGETARRNRIVSWDSERGIELTARRIPDESALRFDHAVEFSNIRSIRDGVVQKIRRGLVGVRRLHADPEVLFNDFYRVWSRLRLSAARSVGEHLADVATAKLLEKGIVPLHGAVVSRNGRSALITGLPNVGKTTSTLRLLGNGYRYQSEDIALVDAHDRTSFGVPYTVSMEVKGAAELARALASLVYKNSSLARTSLLEVGSNVDAYVDQSELEHIVVLDTSQDLVESGISGSKVLEFLLAINRREFKYQSNPLLVGATCCDPTVALTAHAVLERELISRLLESTTIHHVGARTPGERVDRTCNLIEDVLA